MQTRGHLSRITPPYATYPPHPYYYSVISTFPFFKYPLFHPSHYLFHPWRPFPPFITPICYNPFHIAISFMPTFSLTHLSHYTSHHPCHSWITPPTLPPLIDWSTTLLSMHEPIYWGWEVGNGVEYCGFWKDSCKWFCWALNICLPATLGCRKWYGWETTLNCLLTWKFSRALPWLYQVLWRGMRL